MADSVTVDWNALLGSHPRNSDEFYARVPGWPRKYMNCCGKISLAFNGTSDPIANYDYPDKKSPTGKARALQLDNQNYLLAVHDVRAYLTQKYMEPERFGSQGELVDATEGMRAGVIGFGLMHIELWVGRGIHSQG